MTSEIIIMNKNGIALAADSAVTQSHSDRPAHFQNKLFSLTAHHAAGLMIHDRMQLNHVPVQTIIKMFQNTLSEDTPLAFCHYAEQFIDFINDHKTLFVHDKSNLSWVYDAMGFLQKFGSDIFISWREQKRPNTDNNNLRDYIYSCIQNKIEELQDLPSYFMADHKNLRAITTSEIQKFGEYYIDNIFNLVPLNTKIRNALYEMLYLMTVKDNFEFGQTGIVIAGYGQNDIFPSLNYIHIGGIYFDRLKYRITNTVTVTNRNQAQIIPYAAKDTVSAFIKGVHPAYEIYSLQEFKNCLQEGYSAHLNKLNQAQIDLLVEEQYQKYCQKLKRHVLSHHVQPVVESIKFLPCDDLATIAETLVNISSFQDSFMPRRNAIGGYINVASISKGDGFSWIKKPGGRTFETESAYHLKQI